MIKNNGSTYVPIVKYFYDENGSRLLKETYNAAGTAVSDKNWYTGSIQYHENLTASTTDMVYDINGSSRLGTFNRTSTERIYEINDHLGNVRATFKKTNSGNLSLLSYTDYYPFGSEMPGRKFVSGDAYKHGYQGQFTEKDEEVNWDAFELRNWDGRLARWTSIDPANQFWSPYLGMGNDPVNLIDADGGRADNIYHYADGSTYVVETNTPDMHFFQSSNGSWTEGLSLLKFSADGAWKGLGLDNAKIFDSYTSMTKFHSTLNNPVVDAVYKGQQDFIKNTAQFSSDLLQDVGDGVAVVGYGLTLTGVGAPIGIPLSTAGNAMSLTGGLMQAGIEYKAGNNLQAAETLGYTVAGRVLPGAIKTKGLGGEILRQNVSLKVMGINRITNID